MSAVLSRRPQRHRREKSARVRTRASFLDGCRERNSGEAGIRGATMRESLAVTGITPLTGVTWRVFKPGRLLYLVTER